MKIEPNRGLDAALPDDIEPPEFSPTPAEVPAAEILPGEAALDHGAFAFLKVFRHRNYRLFFTGQLISLMGNWITTVTQAWLVYSMTHSPLLLGATAFASQIPVFFLSPFGGMFSDRLDRRRMIMITQALAMLESGALAVLTLTHLITVPEILCLALCQGFINAFDVPGRQGMTVEMVGKEDLRHAISLNSMMFNLARIIGPTVAGLLIAAVGAGFCFALDALSYLAVLCSLFLMQFPPRPVRAHAEPLRAVMDGFAYAWRNREIRSSLLLSAGCTIFGGSYLSMMPAFARDVLHQGSEGLGFLYAAIGAAALLGAYALAHVPDRHLRATPVVAALGFGAALMLFSRSQLYWLSFLLLLPTSFALMLLGGSSNTILQLASRDDMRGRIVAFYAMCVMGTMPWGALLLGWTAGYVGVANAVTVGGAACIAVALFAWYDRRGENWELKAAE